MRLKAGDKVKNIILPGLDGSSFDMASIDGRPFLLSFYRFASCPFCNLRMHELVSRLDELEDSFTMVAVFDSTHAKLIKDIGDHQAPFPILADGNRTYYKSYGIKRSMFGFLYGMPADFLVDAEGVIQTAYYGKDEGDHLSFEEIKTFSHSTLTKA